MEKELFCKLKKSLSELIQIPSVFSEPIKGAPRGKWVKEGIEYCLTLGKELGFTSVGQSRGVVGWLDVGEGEDFGILAHVDVVPAGEGWSEKPFGGVEKDGKIYGRGALDDKGPLLASMYAVHALLKEGKTPKKRIRVIIGGDEEGLPKSDSIYAINDKSAIDIYRESEVMPEVGFSPDADFPVINAEKGILTLVLTTQATDGISQMNCGERPNIVPNKARATLVNGEEIVASGVSAHGAHPDKGDNAIINLFKKLENLGYQDFKRYRELLSDVFGKGLGIDCEDQESGKLTLNLGIVEKKEDKFYFTINIRYPVTVKEEEVINKIKKVWKGEIIKESGALPLFVSKDDELVQKLLESYVEITGESAEPLAIGGGTYAREIPHGVAFGALFPGQVDNMHAPNEYIELELLEKTFEIYKRAIEKLCF